MPELPEVETIRSRLAPRVEGRRLERLEILDPRWCEPLPAAEVSEGLDGRRVRRLGRRGKYLVWDLDGHVFVLWHLRMTGTLLYDPAEDVPYQRVRVHLGDGHRVVFCDPRRFGTGQLAFGPESLEAFFALRLGVEPLQPEFTGEHLRALARGSRAPVKAFLLNQKRIAGVGNIYADEALFRARVHPLRPAGRLTRRQWEAVRDGVVSSLRAGIDASGATIDDFRDPEGVAGSFQHQFLVHRREGEPCPVCGRTVVKLVAAGRGTYACERCQPRPRRLARAARRR